MRMPLHVESELGLRGAVRVMPHRAGGGASIVDARYWRALWTTFRPYLTFVSGAAAAVGLAFGSTTTARTLAVFLPLFLSYGFGQALTDCFQTDTDALSSPYRPLVRGVLSPAQVLVASGAGLTASAVLLSWINPAIVVPATLAVAGLLAYTPLKRTWWGGPPCNAVVVALLPVMGRMADGSGASAALADPAWAAIAAVLLGYADFVVIGYLKDVSADRATGYRTFPVVFGWRAAVLYGDLLAAGSGAAVAYALRSVDATWPAWAALLGSLAVSARGHVVAHQTRDERAAHLAIVDVVRALVLACGAVVIGVRPSWSLAAVAFYGTFELAILARPERTQV